MESRSRTAGTGAEARFCSKDLVPGKIEAAEHRGKRATERQRGSSGSLFFATPAPLRRRIAGRL